MGTRGRSIQVHKIEIALGVRLAEAVYKQVLIQIKERSKTTGPTLVYKNNKW